MGVGDLRLLQAIDHLVGRERGKCIGNRRPQFFTIGHAQRGGGETRIAGQFRALQHDPAERHPLALILHGEHHGTAVADRERPVRVDGGVGRTGAHRRRGAFEGVVHGEAHPLRHALQHRHVDAAALAGAPTQQQSREDAAVGIHAGGNVGDGAAGLGHLVIARTAGDREETALALDQQVVGLLVLVRAAFAVTGNVTDDQAREAFVQRFERQAHARGGARREVLHQHVGLAEQLFQHGLRGVLLEVQAQAFLGTVGPDEMRGHATHALVIATGEVADAGALDLDHPRAEVGELAGAERRGDGVFEADHGDAVEGTGIVHVSNSSRRAGATRRYA
ncbi:hypothetical protein D3C81_1282900 [compost metagenome]